MESSSQEKVSHLQVPTTTELYKCYFTNKPSEQRMHAQWI
uniref:Uncharacterized protein n=1 Tax=Arundo donax TaxID=35708 RepID=A0A0A9HFI4_ARUDO